MIISPFISLFISFSLLVAPLPLSAMAEDTMVPTQVPERDLFSENNVATLYLDMRRESSAIAQVISQLSELDNEQDSLIHQLDKHIKSGFSFAEYDAVMETLAYAEVFLQKNHTGLTKDDAE